MTQPTDADRQRAQRLYRELAQAWTGAEGVNAIATAIAAARAEALRTPAAPPPAHAELAARLRDRADSMEDSDGMSSDTSKLLNEAATALAGDGT